MSASWAIGFVVGIFIVILVRIARGKGAGKGEYDERQQVARGKAYTAAYATLLLYILGWMVLRSLEIPFFTQAISVFVGALLSIAVFVGYSIFSDAYFKASESPRLWIGIICAVGVVNLGLGILHLAREADIQDRLYENYSLFVGLLLAVVLVCLVVKRAMDRTEGE